MSKRDIHASGSTKLDGGEYGEIHVSASLCVDGSLSCDALHCSGSAKIDGNLSCAAEVHCSGSLKVEGDTAMREGRFSGSFRSGGNVTCEELKVSGSAKVGGELRLDAGRFSGSCEVGNDLHARLLSCSGSLRIGRGAEAEEFHSSGKIDIHGLLNAELIDISLCGECSVADIGGSTVSILAARGMLPLAKRSLSVNSIEGDCIELEYVKAAVVRGKKVRIGKGCQIGRVEYSEALENKGGFVESAVKV